MPTIKAKYLGDLRVECQHVQSGTRLITDAPVDNNGKGASFSPTDLCATALGSCIMTIMGIWAKNNNINIDGAAMEITKTMSANPRKIAKVEIIFHMPAGHYSQEVKQALEETARTAPVPRSLNPDVIQDFTFIWP